MVDTWKTNIINAYWNESAKDLFRLDCGFKFYRIHQNLALSEEILGYPVWTQSP